MTVTSTATAASYELWKVSTFTYGTTTGIKQVETNNKVSAFALDGKNIKLSPITAGDKTIINLSELTQPRCGPAPVRPWTVSNWPSISCWTAASPTL